MRYCLACNKQIPEGSYCDPCSDFLRKNYSEPRQFAVVNKVHIRSYGNVSEKRIGELQRRVILPGVESDDGGYVVGRRGENGKIQDKEPDY